MMAKRHRSTAPAARFVLVLIIAAASAATALAQAPKPAQTFRDCPDCPEMAVIPAGEGVIGASPDMPDRRASERPLAAAVIAQPFAMATTETTRAAFARFVEDTRRRPPIGPRPGRKNPVPEGCNFWNGAYGYVLSHDWRNPGFVQRESEPVLCVSYEDAAAFAAWLSRKTGRAYRIPSSVEWEYAARAGAATAWPWGADSEAACTHANIADRTFRNAWSTRPSFNCDDSFLHTAPVARFKPNAFGLHDMIGNAWEWTADCWRDDLTAAGGDPRPITAAEGGDCAFRTPMGGGWISGPGWARPSARSRDPAVYRSFMLGFRVAAALEPASPLANAHP
jgi:formylglycine-generating enzyme required for sulfatase activity